MRHNSSVSCPREGPEPVLRIKICGSPECRATFTICISCDRGQRYCSSACRDVMRRRQRRAADKRYQASEEGRQTHRCRQQRYRKRHATNSVTDQGCKPPMPGTTSASAPIYQCRICGQSSRWIDPYPPIPRRWRWVPRPARSNGVQKTTLSDDR